MALHEGSDREVIEGGAEYVGSRTDGWVQGGGPCLHAWVMDWLTDVVR